MITVDEYQSIEIKWLKFHWIKETKMNFQLEISLIQELNTAFELVNWALQDDTADPPYSYNSQI